MLEQLDALSSSSLDEIAISSFLDQSINFSSLKELSASEKLLNLSSESLFILKVVELMGGGMDEGEFDGEE